MILNKILEETGKQFAKKVLQHAIYEVSSNLIVRGVETAFELYKQKKLMELSLQYQEQLSPAILEGEKFEEDNEEEIVQEPVKPTKPAKKSRTKGRTKSA